MSEPDAQSELARVEDLWFSDATLILRAEDTLFQVYSSILSARSSVFRDMVGFPGPSQPDDDTVDGHAVVRLHDSAAEAEVFLRAILDSSFFKPPPSVTDFTTVIGVMRLAHKYDVQYLFRRALSHLDSVYPTDLFAFMALHTSKTQHHVTGYYWESNIMVLKAASEVGALWILPAVYYKITRFLFDLVLNAPDSHHQKNCLAAQTDFVRATVYHHRFLRHLPDSSCVQVSQCQTLISKAYDELQYADPGAAQDLDPLTYWPFEFTDGDLCSACDAFARQRFEAAQKCFWESLPDIFKLPEWYELEEMQQEVMDGPM
ncbi:hypothetical protein C8R44DRAFT_753183 [Mycena epipterygia]|nr:hypothetical protein C8R44DRAFT_753183 [Mycena epipterygia]